VVVDCGRDREQYSVLDEEVRTVSTPNVVTRKALSRRAVLRGVGATIALPFLDGMVPALTPLVQTAANPVRRLGVIYVGNGAAMGHWTPPAAGPGFPFSLTLTALEPFRDRLVVLSGLENKPADALLGEPAGGHGRTAGAFLTAIHAKPTEGPDFRAGVSMDQMAAMELGKQTELTSLELGLEAVEFAGACDNGFACVYSNTVSWRTPTTPLLTERNPRAVFERLFGDSGSTDPAVRLARMRGNRSILDSVKEKVAGLRQELGAGDAMKFSQYLDSIRDIERRIQTAEKTAGKELLRVVQPAGIPDTFEDHAKLMFDLQVLAYQSDVTRVITFMLAREASYLTYPGINVSEGHHQVSHHRDDPEMLAKLARINAFHIGLFAYYLDRLRSTPDGDGSLLDHVAVMYGSGMGNSNLHDPHNLPILVAGGAAGRIRGNRHIKYDEPRPVSNLYLTLLHKLGVPVEGIGDSTGELAELTEV
jgi:hypothetical protein